MKIVQVNNALRIKNSDQLNWTVEELKISPDTLKSGEANPKAGEETWKALHFYPKLEYACMKCVDIQAAQHADDSVMTMKDVLISIRDARIAIVDAIAKMTEKEAENWEDPTVR